MTRKRASKRAPADTKRRVDAEAEKLEAEFLKIIDESIEKQPGGGEKLRAIRARDQRLAEAWQKTPRDAMAEVRRIVEHEPSLTPAMLRKMVLGFIDLYQHAKQPLPPGRRKHEHWQEPLKIAAFVSKQFTDRWKRENKRKNIPADLQDEFIRTAMAFINSGKGMAGRKSLTDVGDRDGNSALTRIRRILKDWKKRF